MTVAPYYIIVKFNFSDSFGIIDCMLFTLENRVLLVHLMYSFNKTNAAISPKGMQSMLPEDFPCSHINFSMHV